MSTSPAKFSLTQLLRWAIVGAVVFFLGRALWQNWQTIANVRISAAGWGFLALGLLMSMVAHCLAGAIWTDILRIFQAQQHRQEPRSKIQAQWGIQVYLITNLAKYLPGNVWHFYGRFNACKQLKIPAGDAIMSILMEPLLMAAAGLVVAIAAIPLSATAQPSWLLSIALLSLIAVLIGIHPKILNRVLRQVGGAKRKRLAIAPENIPQLQDYPLRALLGELGFVLLRGTGFVITWHSIHSIEMTQLPIIYSSFAIAWLLGLIVPGLPGGIGLFEAVTITLLSQQLSPGQLIVIVALYRVVNTLAEALGAGLAYGQKRHLNLGEDASS